MWWNKKKDRVTDYLLFELTKRVDFLENDFISRINPPKYKKGEIVNNYLILGLLNSNIPCNPIRYTYADGYNYEVFDQSANEFRRLKEYQILMPRL